MERTSLGHIPVSVAGWSASQQMTALSSSIDDEKTLTKALSHSPSATWSGLIGMYFLRMQGGGLEEFQ